MINSTKMLKRYLIKFALRIIIFISVFIMYLNNKEVLYNFITHKFTFGISTYGIQPMHVLWFIFMVMMLAHLIPNEYVSMALRKQDKRQFQPVDGYSDYQLLRFVQDQNIKAWKVLLIWLCFNAFWGVLYLAGVIDSADLLMLTVFYFLCDYICILVYCPFQDHIMKNKCCVNCRIYDWGHFMMFTPMLFIKNFFSWSLFFTSVVVMLRWELVYAKYPERFWSESNRILQCQNCKDKTCRIKKRVTKKR